MFSNTPNPKPRRPREFVENYIGNPLVEFRDEPTIFVEEKTHVRCTHEYIYIRVRLYRSIVGTCDAEQLKSRSALYANANGPPVGVRWRRCRQTDVTMRPRKTG